MCPPDERAYYGPPDPAAAWTALVARHSKAKLLAAGLAENLEGQTSLHRLLSRPDVEFLLLSESPRGRWNIVTDAGCLRGERSPLFEVLMDDRTSSTFSQGGPQEVFLTDSVVDAVLLRSFDLVAVPIADAAKLGQADIELLQAYYGVMRRRDAWVGNTNEEQAGAAKLAKPLMHEAPVIRRLPYLLPAQDGNCSSLYQEHVHLKIVGWRVQNLDLTEPKSSLGLRKELLDLKRFRGLVTDAVTCWRPKDEDARKIRFALERNELTWLLTAVVDGIEDAEQCVDDTAPPAKRAIDLTEAFGGFAGLLPDLADSANCQRTEAAAREFDKIMNRRLLAPLLQQAEQASDPLERALRVQFAALEGLHSKQVATLYGGGRTGTPAALEESGGIKELLATGHQLLALAKEISKWQATTTPRRAAPPLPDLKLSPRFANWDWGGSN